MKQAFSPRMSLGTGAARATTRGSRPERRRLTLLAAAALLVAPFGAGTQPAGKVHRIGWLSGGSPGPGSKPFHDELLALGYVEGQNIIIERRWAEGKPERLAELAAELVRLGVEVILAEISPAAKAAHGATRTIPIVILAVGDPVGLGLAQTLARPGGNVTGVASYGPETAAKSLHLLKQGVPHMRRVAVLWTAANPLHARVLKDVEEPARSLDVRLQPFKVASLEDCEGALRDAAGDQVDAAWFLGDPLFGIHAAALAKLALNARLPTLHLGRVHPEAGSLMSYGPSGAHQRREAAGYVDKILKGAQPGELPIEQPAKFELVVNMKTARAFGLTFQPAFLLQADHLLE